MDVSIIISNYNSKKLAIACINSIYEKTQGVDYEIIVVDNASKDESCDLIEKEFPRVKLIKNPKDVGFGSANNIGIREAKGKYVFLLNIDTILLTNSAKIFFDFMEKKENQEVACCGGNLLNEDYTIGYSYGNFPTILNVLFQRFYLHKFFKKYYLKKFSPSFGAEPKEIKEVEFISGANMFLRKSVLDEIGLFDEDFYLYYEETELSYRMYKKGYKRVFIPESKIIHLGGATVTQSPQKLKIVKESELMFFEKCYGKNQARIVNFIHLLGEIPRFFVKNTKRVFKIKR